MADETERIALLIAILRHPTPGPKRLDLGLSELTVHVDGARCNVIREMLQVREEEIRMEESQSGESYPLSSATFELTATAPDATLLTHMHRKPVTAMDITPETSEKRSSGAMHDQENAIMPMTNVADTFSDRAVKKMKASNRPPPLDLVQVFANQNSYETYNWPTNGTAPPSGPNPSPAWSGSLGLSAPPPHLSPYPHGEWNSAPPTEYVRSPQLNFDAQAPHPASQSKFGTHLAPMASHSIPSPVDSTYSSSQVGYFPRSHSAAGFLQHQQADYMQQHQIQQQLHHQQQQQYHHQIQHQQQMAQVGLSAPQSAFDYGSPFVNDWAEQDFTTSS